MNAAEGYGSLIQALSVGNFVLTLGLLAYVVILRKQMMHVVAGTVFALSLVLLLLRRVTALMSTGPHGPDLDLWNNGVIPAGYTLMLWVTVVVAYIETRAHKRQMEMDVRDARAELTALRREHEAVKQAVRTKALEDAPELVTNGETS